MRGLPPLKHVSWTLRVETKLTETFKWGLGRWLFARVYAKTHTHTQKQKHILHTCPSQLLPVEPESLPQRIKRPGCPAADGATCLWRTNVRVQRPFPSGSRDQGDEDDVGDTDRSEMTACHRHLKILLTRCQSVMTMMAMMMMMMTTIIMVIRVRRSVVSLVFAIRIGLNILLATRLQRGLWALRRV